MSQRLALTIADDLYEYLQAQAKREGVSMASIASRILCPILRAAMEGPDSENA